MMKHVSKKVYSQVSISSGCEFQVIQKYSVIGGGEEEHQISLSVH